MRVWLGLGSNVDAEKHLRSAISALKQHYQPLVVSPVYESQAVGFDGDNFLNLVVGIETAQPLDELNQVLKEIEAQNGRERLAAKFSDRTLDIDILTYGDLDLTEQGINIPRHEILTYAFVLKPLSDVAPDELHPHIGLPYLKLWEGFDQASQSIRLFSLDFS